MPLTIATPRTIASAVRTARSLRPSRPLNATASRANLLERPQDLVLDRAAELLDDQAVGEEQNPVGDRGRPRVVGHHHHRLPEVTHRLLEQLEDLAARLRVEVAVGSSAKTTVGFDTSARAIATRCCWPPESSEGRWRQAIGEADALQQLGERAR